MDILVVINQMVMLFLLILIGYGAVKARFIEADLQRQLSGFIMKVTMPFMMITSASAADRTGAGQTVLVSFAVAAAAYAVTPFLGYAIARLLRVPKSQEKIYVFFTVFSNIGFMGFPVIDAIFGPKALIIAVIFNLLFNILQFTYGITLFSGHRVSLDPRTLLTPWVSSAILAILMFLLGIRLPGVVFTAFKTLGDTTTPLAMLVIGISLAQIPIRQVFSDLRLYPYILIRQLLLPAGAWLILRAILADPLILGVATIVLAMPSAASTVIFANAWNNEVSLATRAVFLTTLASVITIPFIAALVAV